jgi:hypothetical protein
MTAVLILFGNSAASIPESDKRCRIDGLRETFGLIGVSIRLSMRAGSENPYAPKKRRGRGILAQSAPSAEDRSPRPVPGERASNLTDIRLWFIRSNGLGQEATP